MTLPMTTSSAIDRSQLSEAKRALLERRLRGRAGTSDAVHCAVSQASPPITLLDDKHVENTGGPRGDGVAPVRLPRPLRLVRPSFTQERYLHLTQQSPAVTQHAQILRLSGPLDLSRLREGFSSLVSRHEILRTTYPDTLTGPIQHVLPPAPFELCPETPSGRAASDRWDWVRELGQVMQREPLALECVAPFRVRLFRLDPQDHALLWVANHILYDDWSSRILFEDLSAFYGGRSSPDPAIQHADYSEWWRCRFHGAHAAQLVDYWRSTLDGCSARVEIPYDATSEDWPFRTAEAHLTLRPAEAAAIVRLGTAEGATLFVVLLSATIASLSRWTGQRDLLVGTSYADRGHPMTHRVMGPLINWLPIRVRFPETWSPGEERRIVGRALFGAIEHHACPLEEMGIPAAAPRSSRFGLQPYNVKFTLRNAMRQFPLSADLICRASGIEDATSRYDLQFLLEVPPQPALDGLRLRCVYNAGGISAAQIQSLLAAIRRELGLSTGEQP